MFANFFSLFRSHNKIKTWCFLFAAAENGDLSEVKRLIGEHKKLNVQAHGNHAKADIN